MDVPRGKYIGRRLGDPPQDEAEHFIRCQARRSSGAVAQPSTNRRKVAGAATLAQTLVTHDHEHANGED